MCTLTACRRHEWVHSLHCLIALRITFRKIVSGDIQFRIICHQIAFEWLYTNKEYIFCNELIQNVSMLIKHVTYNNTSI